MPAGEEDKNTVGEEDKYLGGEDKNPAGQV
jgi:hypothetical protein